MEELLYDVLPYISNMEFIKNLIKEAKDINELEKKVKEMLEKEDNITKKTDLKILLEKIEIYKQQG
ncbi:hypothetical protein J422_03216 [Methanocaldococcus villosus KIN24-T80]|uniref:Uncharacterized protein n=1 Tax=Methanocaldococcus villosus KIN24-T80 TaxID=1069083 RepID=N6VQV3_9EURY|nr:hypothetical protein J422_03216 [Methanocaldococcus villosus KIN24-T80]